MRTDDLNSISEALKAERVNKIHVRSDIRSPKIRRIIEVSLKILSF